MNNSGNGGEKKEQKKNCNIVLKTNFDKRDRTT